MSRSQVIDILERNVELYKDEPAFVRYLVELAIYLMEYEYNWEESDAEPPPNLPPCPDEPRPQVVQKGNKIVVSSLQQTSSQHSRVRHFCPFCGTEVGDLMLCPACRNLTR